MLSVSSIPLRIEMFDNSGRDAQISFKDDQYSFSSVEIKVGEKVRNLLERSLVIKVGGASNTYNGRLVPEAFVDYSGWAISQARYTSTS